MIRTGNPRNAIFKWQHRAEYAWFSIGDSLPCVSMHASDAAEQILTACRQGRGEVMIDNPFNLVIAFQRLFPEVTEELVGLVAGELPKMGGIGRNAAKDYESESAWSQSGLTTLTQKAADANNQL